jgi:hypothetical protein
VRTNQKKIFPLLIASFVAVLARDVSAGERAARPVDGIMDNSFLVEEAYNQEPGVVQHIFTTFYSVTRAAARDEHAWAFAFTQEWPVVSQRHQFSYTIPWSSFEAGGARRTELNDVLLNYRYQVYLDEKTLTGFSPRLSLVLPTGDPLRGAGDDTVGYQLNLPFSTTLNDRVFVHANAGLTFLPGANSLNNRDALHFNLGASTIYALTGDVHLMLEWVGFWIEQPSGAGATSRALTSFVSPGVRKAFNFERDRQLVIGVAAPIGVTRDSPDWGVFAYLSFEHFFSRPK